MAVFGASNFPSPSPCPAATRPPRSPPAVRWSSRRTAATLTSALCGRILREAAEAHGAPDGTLSLVFGTGAGLTLVADPRISAVAFTGGHGGAAALKSAIASRPVPIPFYGELGGVNPLVVTPRAADERVPRSPAVSWARSPWEAASSAPNPDSSSFPRAGRGRRRLGRTPGDGRRTSGGHAQRGIAHSYRDGLDRLGASADLTVAEAGDGEGFRTRPAVAVLDAEHFDASRAEEIFGPLAVLVRYRPRRSTR
ncbi:aldehyde dehydrogenase family protein [Streptomyces sp. M19]